MHYSRRSFLSVSMALIPLPLVQRSAWASPRATHPDPRPGITGAKVLKADKLKKYPDLIEVFDGIREFPQIADGIRCSCGCATLPSHRSLLSCYEDPAMAVICEICQGQGQLVVRRAREGQTLQQIRQAIDARFSRGGGGVEEHTHTQMNHEAGHPWPR